MAHKSHKKNARKTKAEQRQAVREGRSIKQQLEVLNLRLGEDIGACKERLRLKSKA